LNDQPQIIYDNQTLVRSYHKLRKNDIICGNIRLKPGEEHLIADLLARGIKLIPSATAQLASRSKVFQAKVFEEFMLPGTQAVYDNHTLLDTSSLYQKLKFTKVILKCDRKNAGLGIHLFNTIEELYNLVVCGKSLHFPFVIQPFQPHYNDIRVIILDDYHEGYERTNPYNFRNNLHCGGQSTVYNLSKQQLSFCRDVMHRGGFTCAHIDLMLTPDGGCWLTEINLNGGLKGASISRKEYQERIQKNQKKMLSMLNNPEQQ